MSNQVNGEEALQILDEAFGMAKHASGRLGHPEAKERLQQRFPKLSFDEVTEIYLRAAALADSSYEIGDLVRSGRTTEAKALALLQERFPGFGKETYKEAISWGYFLSR